MEELQEAREVDSFAYSQEGQRLFPSVITQNAITHKAESET